MHLHCSSLDTRAVASHVIQKHMYILNLLVYYQCGLVHLMQLHMEQNNSAVSSSTQVGTVGNRQEWINQETRTPQLWLYS